MSRAASFRQRFWIRPIDGMPAFVVDRTPYKSKQFRCSGVISRYGAEVKPVERLIQIRRDRRSRWSVFPIIGVVGRVDRAGAIRQSVRRAGLEAAVALRDATKIVREQRTAQIWERFRTVAIRFVRSAKAVDAGLWFAAITVVRATKAVAAHARLRLWAIKVAAGA
jgi:hypothetical protein